MQSFADQADIFTYQTEVSDRTLCIDAEGPAVTEGYLFRDRNGRRKYYSRGDGYHGGDHEDVAVHYLPRAHAGAN